MPIDKSQSARGLKYFDPEGRVLVCVCEPGDKSITHYEGRDSADARRLVSWAPPDLMCNHTGNIRMADKFSTVIRTDYEVDKDGRLIRIGSGVDCQLDEERYPAHQLIFISAGSVQPSWRGNRDTYLGDQTVAEWERSGKMPGCFFYE